MKGKPSPPKTQPNPLIKRLLRSPGEYLSEQETTIQLEVLQRGTNAVLSLALTFLAIYWHYWPPTLAIAITLGIAGLGITLHAVWKCILLLRRLQACRFGRAAEVYVSQLLNREKDRDWHIFDDVQMGGYNIDHALVAPQGIFCIETKARRRKDNHMKPVTYNGQTLLIDGYPDKPRNILRQVERTRNNLQQYLFYESGQQFEIRAVLVFPESSVINTVRNKAEDTLWVMNPQLLSATIRNLQPILTPQQRDAACQALRTRDRIVPGS